MVKKNKAIFCIGMMWSSWAMAATDGTLGATSTGTVGISITLPALVRVSGLSDIAMGTVSTFPATGNTTACIYSSVVSPLGSYFVTATSANPDTGAFRVNNSGVYITYSAFWNNTSAADPTTALTSGIKTAQQTGGSSTSLTCGVTPNPNANFNISFSQTQVEGAAPGTYTDTVTLLITST